MAERAIQCYRRAIAHVRSSLLISRPVLRQQLQGRLDRIVSMLDRTLTPELLDVTLRRFEEVLGDYRVDEEMNHQEEQQHLRKTVIALQELASILQTRNVEQSHDLNDVVAQLEAALFESNLADLHQNLQEQIARLRTCVVTMSEDNLAHREKVEAQIRSLIVRAEKDGGAADSTAASLAACDARLRLEQHIASYALFSVILLEAMDLSRVADEWSFACRNEALRLFGDRIQRFVGPSETLHLWGEGEFLIIMGASLTPATERLARIQESLVAPYRVKLSTGAVELRLRSAAGVVEYISGENAENLIERLELSLFRNRQLHAPRRPRTEIPWIENVEVEST